MGADKSAILESAQLFTARGQFDKAIAEWKKLTAGTPADGTIYNTIGDLHLKRNAPADAIEAYFKAAAAFQEGEAALKAIALYKKILKVDPNRAEAYRRLGALNAERGLIGNAVSDYLLLAKMYLRSGKSREALEVYRTIASLDPSNLEAQQQIAELSAPGQQEEGVQGQVTAPSASGPGEQINQAGQQRDEAFPPEPDAGGAAMADPGQARGLPKGQPEWSRQDCINEAGRLTVAGRYGEAEAVLSELLDREPGDPEVCRLLAMLHLRGGKLSFAKAEFQFLAEAAMRAQDFPLAESMLREYLTADPDCVALCELMGRLYEQTGEAALAAEQYAKVIQALLVHPDPDQPALPAELYGRIKQLTPSGPFVSRFAPVLEASSLERVREDIRLPGQVERPAPPAQAAGEIRTEQAAPVRPSPPAVQFKFAHTEETRESAQRGEPTRPEPAGEPAQEAHYQLGLAYKNMGLLAEAVEEFQLARQGGDWFPDACRMLAACFKDQGRERQAIPYLEQVLADARCEGETALSVRYELGLLYEAAGQHDRARQLLSLIPDFQDVAQRLERLELMRDRDQAEALPVGAKKKRRVSYI